MLFAPCALTRVMATGKRKAQMEGYASSTQATLGPLIENLLLAW